MQYICAAVILFSGTILCIELMKVLSYRMAFHLGILEPKPFGKKRRTVRLTLPGHHFHMRRRRYYRTSFSAVPGCFKDIVGKPSVRTMSISVT